MTDENTDTADLTMNEIPSQILAEITDINAGLGAVETGLGELKALVEDRLKGLPQIWQTIDARTERIEESLDKVHEQLRTVDRKFGIVSTELLDMKVDLRDFDKRLTKSERRQN